MFWPGWHLKESKVGVQWVFTSKGIPRWGTITEKLSLWLPPTLPFQWGCRQQELRRGPWLACWSMQEETHLKCRCCHFKQRAQKAATPHKSFKAVLDCTHGRLKRYWRVSVITISFINSFKVFLIYYIYIKKKRPNDCFTYIPTKRTQNTKKDLSNPNTCYHRNRL